MLPARVGAGLDVSFAGRTFDTALLTDLPASTDPCGVNGELEIDPPYTEGWTPRDGWMTAPHQAEAVPRWLERAGHPWAALACASILRDRHDVGLIRRYLVAE